MSFNQLSVFLENRYGQLAEITGILASKGIDLCAIHIAETSDYGVIRMITDDSEAAVNCLKEAEFMVRKTPVLIAAVENRPGGLAEMLKVLAEAGIDIEYIYSIFGEKNGVAYMVFRTKDNDTAEEVLKRNGYRIAEPSELGIC